MLKFGIADGALRQKDLETYYKKANFVFDYGIKAAKILKNPELKKKWIKFTNDFKKTPKSSVRFKLEHYFDARFRLVFLKTAIMESSKGSTNLEPLLIFLICLSDSPYFCPSTKATETSFSFPMFS